MSMDGKGVAPVDPLRSMGYTIRPRYTSTGFAWWRVLIASGIIGLFYAEGGYFRLFALLIIVSLLLKQDANGETMLGHFIDFGSYLITGELK